MKHKHLNGYPEFIEVLFVYSLDINNCETKPCKNGGICEDGNNIRTCTCRSGYIGNDCENGKIIK